MLLVYKVGGQDTYWGDGHGTKGSNGWLVMINWPMLLTASVCVYLNVITNVIYII